MLLKTYYFKQGVNLKKVLFNLGDTVSFTILSEPITIPDLFGNIKYEQEDRENFRN